MTRKTRLNPTATTADISTQTTTDVAKLLLPNTPAATRLPAGSVMLTAFQSGHGWTKFPTGTGSAGSVADDTVTFAEGSQSFKLTTAGTGLFTDVLSPTLSPTVDLTRNSLMVKFRADQWARLSGVLLYCSSDTDMSTNRGQVQIGSSVSGYATDGEWAWVSVNPGDWTTSGGFAAPNYAALTHVGFAAQDLNTGALQINLQQVWTRPAPTGPCTIIVFDDGYQSQYDSARPYMDKYGMRGVVFPIRDLIGTPNATGTYMGTTMLQALYDSGWDISGHADTGAAHNATNALNDLSTTDGTATALSSFEAQLVANKKWLLANGWTRAADFFAWPQGKFDATRLTIARKYFSLIRTYAVSMFAPYADTYPFVDGGRLRQVAVQSGVGSPTPSATANAALDTMWAANKTVVLTFHGLGSANSYEYPVASFQAIIDHIAASGYPVKTLSEVMRDNGISAPSSNAATATKWATARTVDGQSLDGTANITVIAPGTHAATSKATPVDADEVPLVDSAASNVLKKLTWANLKSTLVATLAPGQPSPTQSGFLGWTVDPLIGCAAAVVQTAGFVAACRVVADQAGSCANLVMYCSVAASGMTSLNFQLFNASGSTELANTGDVKASFAAAAGKTIPWVTPVTLVAGTTYYVVMTPVGGTPPSLGRAGPSGVSLGTTIIPTTRFGQISGGGATVPPTSFTPGSLAAGNLFWFALKT